MGKERPKSEAELAREELKRRGVNTKGAEISIVDGREFDSETGQFKDVKRIRKTRDDHVIDYPYTPNS